VSFKNPDGFAGLTSRVSSFSNPRRLLTIACSSPSCGRLCRCSIHDEFAGILATASSRLFISMRKAASWCHPLHETSVPRGA